MDRTYSNDPNDCQCAREWTERTALTSRVHGNALNPPERTRRSQGRANAPERTLRPAWRMRMDRTHTNEPDYSKCARECTKRTRTIPTSLRAYGNGPNAPERTLQHRARTERTRTSTGMGQTHTNEPDNSSAHWDGPNAPERTIRPAGCG